MEVEDNKEEEKEDMPTGINDQTPPMSPIYMPMTNDPDPEVVRYGAKGVKRNRGKRLKQTTRRSTGGKTPKRVLKEISKDKGKILTLKYLDSLDYVTEDVDFLFNDDQEDRNKTRTPFQKMELPSEY